jgi:DNA-binding CsgD family transcriptional regulator
VLELSSQGLTQQEIASKLMVSQKTVSNDFTWLRKAAMDFEEKTKNM